MLEKLVSNVSNATSALQNRGEGDTISPETKEGSFLSPEGLMMLSLAIFVDVGEFFIEFIPYVGTVISILLDIFAVIFIGGWMWFRSGNKSGIGRTGKAAKWAKRLKWFRPLCIIIECIPLVGSLPLWTVAVYLEIKYN